MYSLIPYLYMIYYDLLSIIVKNSYTYVVDFIQITRIYVITEGPVKKSVVLHFEYFCTPF